MGYTATIKPGTDWGAWEGSDLRKRVRRKPGDLGFFVAVVLHNC